MKNYDVTTIKRAIENSGGLYTVIAAKLKCEWHTAKTYVESLEETRQAYINESESMVDVAEGKLIENIKSNDNTAIIFYLKTKGKHRGYIERSEFTGKDGKELNTTIVVQSQQAKDDDDKL